MSLPAYAGPGERVWYYSFRVFCGLVFLFLILPIIIIIPLSFNAEPYFSFSEGMLRLDPDAYSLRWYMDILTNGMSDRDAPFGWSWIADSWNNAQWLHSMRNSFFIAFVATILATVFGTLAALGLSQADMPYRNLIMSLLIAPMIVPLIITAAALFFFLSDLGLSQTYTGIIIAHAVLGVPFVVITVTATLVGFDRSLMRAGANMGANPRTVFFKIVMPLITPGMISGALFAFITSFDEVVAVIFLAGFEQRTIPRQMWSGLREQISPTILAVATIMVTLSIILLTILELLRRRSERLRGIKPQ
jgi:putative spermidine/putrescine transport system permease protein